ncbi:39S ribosomal protein L16, mitochondrial [Mycoemilia scoparia]|uniref:39S ribosomal protein L16, mitochondrial n=1 Tax=Mycoemilia scoparia TaxID=417184 RepID=A0A9W8DT66_9FUNG|nr:39S ribosomal protein L16, mitochondrial [Mycoemilia scoparia]
MLGLGRQIFTTRSSPMLLTKIVQKPATTSISMNLAAKFMNLNLVINQKSVQARAFSQTSIRLNQTLQPRRTKHKKAQKGRVPVRTGGSTKGNYIAFGEYGIRLKIGARLPAKVLTACYTAIRRKLKPIKGSKIWLRVFPDIPVTTKGLEVRMGKGKGAFDYWACRVPKDKILFEIGGGGLSPEIAREAFRIVSHKLPVKSEFVIKTEETSQPKVFPPTTIPFQHAK